jgi:hypothetical protein
MSDMAPSRKRVCEFLSECLEVKKHKHDLEPVMLKKKAEIRRINDQIAKLKEQIIIRTRKLQAKEVVAGSLNNELESLIMEWNSSVE